MVLDSEIHKFQIGLDWDCCYFRKLHFYYHFYVANANRKIPAFNYAWESPSYNKYLQPYTSIRLVDDNIHLNNSTDNKQI